MSHGNGCVQKKYIFIFDIRLVFCTRLIHQTVIYLALALRCLLIQDKAEIGHEKSSLNQLYGNSGANSEEYFFRTLTVKRLLKNSRLTKNELVVSFCYCLRMDVFSHFSCIKILHQQVL